MASSVPISEESKIKLKEICAVRKDNKKFDWQQVKVMEDLINKAHKREVK